MEAMIIAKMLANAEQPPSDEIFDILKLIRKGDKSYSKSKREEDEDEEYDEEYDDEDDNVATGSNQRFFPADKERLKKALGSLTDNCDFMTRKALSNISKYW